MTEEKKQEKTEQQEAPKLTELEEKAKLADEYLDQLQRLQADFENYRKRAIKDKEDFRKYALEGFTYSLLEVVDNFQRAIDASGQNHNYDSLVSGINIVEKQFIELLKAQGVKPISINPGDKFDPHTHHAVTHENSDDFATDTLIKILQPGYTIGDRVLRPAMVIVSNGSAKRPEEKQETKKEEKKETKSHNSHKKG